MTDAPASLPPNSTRILRVAIDARFAVLDVRGIGRYTRELARRLLASSDVACTFVVPGWTAPRRRIAAALGIGTPRIATRVPPDADVVWHPSNALDVRSNAPDVTMVHDLAPFAFPNAERRVREREQLALVRAATGSRRLLVNSNYTADEVQRYLGVARERIVVTPLGVAAAFGADGERYRLPDGRDYVLHVGAHDPRKQTRLLVAAWQRAFPNARVALVFSRRPPTLPAGALVADAADDARLAALYRGAALLALPSIDEGFGLPLLEALACGTPVLASRVAALPEVGADAAVYVDDARAIAAWAAGLRALYGDARRRAELAQRGPERAAAFSWERCAALTLDALRAAAWS